MSHTPAQSWRLARERRQRPGAAAGWTWPGCGAGGSLRGARQFTWSTRFSQRSTSFQSSCQTAALSGGTPARLPGKQAARHHVPRRQLLSSPGTSPRQVGGQCARIRWHTMFPVRRGLGQPCDGRQDGGEQPAPAHTADQRRSVRYVSSARQRNRANRVGHALALSNRRKISETATEASSGRPTGPTLREYSLHHACTGSFMYGRASETRAAQNIANPDQST
jgi:hypothetical protein